MSKGKIFSNYVGRFTLTGGVLGVIAVIGAIGLLLWAENPHSSEITQNPSQDYSGALLLMVLVVGGIPGAMIGFLDGLFMGTLFSLLVFPVMNDPNKRLFVGVSTFLLTVGGPLVFLIIPLPIGVMMASYALALNIFGGLSVAIWYSKNIKAHA